MNQRLVAACIASPLVIALLAYAGLAKLPYATYSPGGTVDVLGIDENEAEIIQVDGAEVYRDAGEIRMTTVSVSQPQPKEERGLPLLELLGYWADGDDAVYPYTAVHEEDETQESSRREGAVQMATSQDSAVRAALLELDYDVPQVLQVAAVTEDMPAEKVLQVGDQLLTINGVKVDRDPEAPDEEELIDLITSAEPGQEMRIGIKRNFRQRTVTLTPVEKDDRLQIGIAPGYAFDFPFDVNIRIDPRIGGPSAGLVFALAVYDTLTPGSLTGDKSVAGTGEITPDGTVEPIGGIQQKIAGARESGADLFLVPAANWEQAQGADPGDDMRLLCARDLNEVRVAIEAWAEDGDVDLPNCDGDS